MRKATSIAPIVLAAGDSTRMGYPKALLPLGDDTFLTHILATIEKVGLSKPSIVLGKAAPIIQPKIHKWQADVFINPDPDKGQLSSIRLALSHLNPGFDACMIWPVDHPAVSEKLVSDLVQLFVNNSLSLIALPSCRQKRGHPGIFDRILFRELMEAPLKKGPKEVLSRHQKEIAILHTDELAAIQDIDTPEDYRALTGKKLSFALGRNAG